MQFKIARHQIADEIFWWTPPSCLGSAPAHVIRPGLPSPEQGTLERGPLFSMS